MQMSQVEIHQANCLVFRPGTFVDRAVEELKQRAATCYTEKQDREPSPVLFFLCT